MVKGKSIEEALQISNRAVAEALDGPPPIKMHCSVLAEEALKSAIEDYKQRKREEVTKVNEMPEIGKISPEIFNEII